MRRPSLISQAATTAKQGFRNSLGWSDMPGSEIQRRAPLISTPITRVAAVSASATMQPTMARRRIQRGESNDTPQTIAPASARKITCLTISALRGSPIRSATAGLAARIRM